MFIYEPRGACSRKMGVSENKIDNIQVFAGRSANLIERSELYKG